MMIFEVVTDLDYSTSSSTNKLQEMNLFLKGFQACSIGKVWVVS